MFLSYKIIGRVLTLMAFLPIMSSCGKIWSSLTYLSQPSSPLPIVTVTSSLVPLYSNGVGFLNYVKNDGASFWTASNTACNGTENKWNACLDGGEYLQLPLPASLTSTCVGITANDTLGLLRWTCKVISGTPTLLSYGFNTGKGIKDTLTAGGLHFQTVGINIYIGGQLRGQMSPTSWWNNNLVALPNNSAGPKTNITGYPAGTILTVASSRLTYGYNIQQSNVAIVTLANVTLTFAPGMVANCDSGGGPDAGPYDTYAGVCVGNGPVFDWVETNVNCNSVGGGSGNGSYAYSPVLSTWRASAFYGCGGQGAVSVRYSSFSRFESITVYNNSATGFYAQGSSMGSNLVSDLLAYGNGVSGIFDGGAFGNSVYMNITTINNGADGMQLSSSGSAYVNLFSANNGGNGITFLSPAISTGVRILATNNAGHGIYHDFNDQFTTLLVTTANNAASGIHVHGAQPNSLTFNMLGTNNSIGVDTDNTGFHLKNAAVVDNAVGLQLLFGGTSINLLGSVVVGDSGTADCQNLGGGSTGILTGTCDASGTNGSTSWAPYAQTATLYTGQTAAASIKGQVASDSTAGASGQLASAITDWTNFANAFRAWGLQGSPLNPFPSTNQIGRCTGATACEIWDWSLNSSAPFFLNRSNDAYNLNSASAILVNGQSCPAVVAGNISTTDYLGHTFLNNAFEIVNDPALNPSGNNDGLCESNEACVYAPNIGYYQGSGDYSQTTCGTITAGAVSGVTMYGYPVNGN